MFFELKLTLQDKRSSLHWNGKQNLIIQTVNNMTFKHLLKSILFFN